MSVETGYDLQLDVFGGTLTEVGVSNMPAGGSPANLNVEFLPGLVRTRGGLQPQTTYTAGGGPYQVREVQAYENAPGSPSQIVFLVSPTDNTHGLVSTATSNLGLIVGCPQQPWAPYNTDPGWGGALGKSTSQFGRQYIAISGGPFGADLPRQWDGTNYDRVSQCGVGAPPSVQDYTVSYTPASISETDGTGVAIDLIQSVGTGIGNVQTGSDFPADIAVGDIFEVIGTTNWNGSYHITNVFGPNNIEFATNNTSAAEFSGTTFFSMITVVINSALPIGSSFLSGNATISGSSVTAYNITWTIRRAKVQGSPINRTTIVMYSSTGVYNQGAATGGTVTQAGSISAGRHFLSVSFITRQGYITIPSPYTSWTAAGNLKALVSNIPIGPANVVARLLMFTIVSSSGTPGDFYSIRQAIQGSTDTVMQVNDNTTTQVIANFDDTSLATGFNCDSLFSQIELGCCSGVFAYAQRLFWWGELNSMQDFLNMEFNGGWSLGTGTGGSDVPLGWISDPTYGAGGSRLASGGVWMDAYQIHGSGSANPVGMITQSAYQNYLGTTLLASLTQYGVRVTALASSSADSITVDIYDPLNSAVLATASLSGWGNTKYSTQIVNLSLVMPASMPSDTVMRVYGSANLANGHTINVDRIEVFPALAPVNYTVVRVSGVNNPESFDGVTGILQPVSANGQAVRTVYQLRDSIYIVLDRQTHVTKNVPGAEPTANNGWTTDPVSLAIGTVGVNSADAGEDWEVKVNRYGLYIYLGREPEKLSQEIQSLWNKEGLSNIINWAYGWKIWTAVDILNKRVYVGAPVGSSTECNTVFVMDYNTLDTSEMIAEYPTLRFSPYTGRRVILEQGRKWTTWTFLTEQGAQQTIPCGRFVEQPGYIAQFLMGGDADNNVYKIDPTMRGNDNGRPVLSSYTGHFFPTQDVEQGAQGSTGPIRAHSHLFSFLRKYLSGVGTLNVFVYKDNLSNPLPLCNINMTNPGKYDEEKDVEVDQCERFALKWQTSQLNQWWQVERMVTVVEQDPNGLIRGTNLH